MRVIRLIIDGREYGLPSDQDTEAIQAAITEQVRAGGGFVQLVRTSHRILNVLVSPALSLSLEITQVDEDPHEFDLEHESSRTSWFDPFDLT